MLQLRANAVDLGGFYSSEGNFTRQDSINWPSSPDALSKH
jgi:hypothetical protein